MNGLRRLLRFRTRVSRLAAIVVIAWVLSPITDPDGERLTDDIPASGCAVLPRAIDHAGIIEQLQHAYAWNRLLANSPLMAINHDEDYSLEEILTKVEDWSPLIVCIAHEFDEPPELVAGILALELDLDYPLADVIVDGVIRTPIGNALGNVEMGAGYAQVHLSHLRPAVLVIGKDFSTSPFYRDYYRMTTTRTIGDLTLIATRYPVADIANAAAMARYYAGLRLGKRSPAEMTIEDMAFVFSAYRGGVAGTPADPRKDSRWSVEYLQRADNPHLFGDTIIALPYFAYYRGLFQAARLCFDDPDGCAGSKTDRTEVSYDATPGPLAAAPH